MDKLLAKLSDHGLFDGVYITLETYEDGSVQLVDVETFKSLFPLTTGSYTSLKTMDNGKGYTPFFDKWKVKNII